VSGLAHHFGTFLAMPAETPDDHEDAAPPQE
jgi:hypothetical protein